MNKVKRISTFLLLLIMTAVIIFLPRFTSGQNEESLLNETIYWKYNTQDNAKITSKQVAQLYSDHSIYIDNYNYTMIYDISKVQQDSAAMFEAVFESDESVCGYMKKLISDGSLQYSCQSSTLIMIDNRPLALNFIDVTITTADGGSLEFTYEEKTKTLIRFSHQSLSYSLDYEEKSDSLLDALNSVIENYYENQLELWSEDYYYQYEYVDEFDWQGYFFSFGII